MENMFGVTPDRVSQSGFYTWKAMFIKAHLRPVQPEPFLYSTTRLARYSLDCRFLHAQIYQYSIQSSR